MYKRQGQQVRCTNDHFSGAVWEWTSALPKAGETYTIAALNRLPQWNTRTPILCFLLREMERETDHAFFSAWRFEPVNNTLSWANGAHVHLLQDHRP